MADYYPSIAEAIGNLGNQNTAEGRGEIYDRARQLLLAHLDYADSAERDHELRAFEDACRKAEVNFANISQKKFNKSRRDSLRDIGNNVLLHLFGDSGAESLRSGNWRFISVIVPPFGLFADVCTIFGRAAPTLSVVCAILAILLAVPIIFRTKYYQHCAVPCVLSFILLIAFGFVAITQKVFAAEEVGIAGKFVPGVAEIQTMLTELVGIQKATLNNVAKIQSDTSDIRQQLSAVGSQLETNNAAVQRLINNMSHTDPTLAMAEDTRTELDRAFSSMQRGAATDKRYAQAIDLLNRGNATEAEQLLQIVAEEGLKRGDIKGAAAAYRNLAAVTATSDPYLARDQYATAAQLDPDDVQGMADNLRFQSLTGHLDEAEAAARKILSADADRSDEVVLLAKTTLGAAQFSRGQLVEALTTYQEALADANQLRRSYPLDPRWQRASASINLGIGDIEGRNGNLSEAIKSYQAGLSALRKYVSSYPGQEISEALLTTAYLTIGKFYLSHTQFANASEYFGSGLTMVEFLAQAHPDQAVIWQDYVTDFLVNLSNVNAEEGNLAEAIALSEKAVQIAAQLATVEPNNVLCLERLAYDYKLLSSLQFSRRLFADAAKSATGWRDAMKQLTAIRPNNLEWMRDLSMAYLSLGLSASAQNNVADAMSALRAGREISTNLANQNPRTGPGLLDLSGFNDAIGDVLAAQGKFSDAINAYQDGLKIHDQLVKDAPQNSNLQAILGNSYMKLTAAYISAKQPASAVRSIAAGRAIFVHLSAQYPDSTTWKQNVAWFDQQSAALKN